MKITKQHVTHIAILIVCTLLIYIVSLFVQTDYSEIWGRTDYGAQQAEVIEIIERTTSASQIQGVDGSDLMIIFSAEIQSGLAKGSIVTAAQLHSPFEAVSIAEIQEGDKIILRENLDMESEINWFFSEFVRMDGIYMLAAIFALALIIFAQIKGFNALYSLLLTCYAIFAVLVPAIISGYDIYTFSIGVCIYIIFATILILNGIDKKSLAAILGCSGGVLLTGALTIFMNDFLGMTGLVDEESMFLLHLNPQKPMDLKAILFAAIIIGAVGAIMDVAVSLASALHEISITAENPTTIQLIRSGFTIGRDIMGTMANTLVLAYIGSSLSVTLLLIAYSESMLLLLNNEMIIAEFMQAIVGSFGILFAIPLTTLACSILYPRKKSPTPE